MCTAVQTFQKDGVVAVSKLDRKEFRKKRPLDDQDDDTNSKKNDKKKNRRKEKHALEDIQNKKKEKLLEKIEQKIDSVPSDLDETSNGSSEDESTLKSSKSQLLGKIRLLQEENRNQRLEIARFRNLNSISKDLPVMMENFKTLKRSLGESAHAAIKHRSLRSPHKSLRSPHKSLRSPRKSLRSPRKSKPERQATPSKENLKICVSNEPKEKIPDEKIPEENILDLEEKILEEDKGVTEPDNELLAEERETNIVVKAVESRVENEDINSFDEWTDEQKVGFYYDKISEQLSRLNKSDMKKFTKDCMTIICSRVQMATSCITGEAANFYKNTSKEPKKQFSLLKLEAIKRIIGDQFGNLDNDKAKSAEFKKAVREKLNNESTKHNSSEMKKSS